VSGGQVNYAGPNEWSYRRFVLHLAALAKAAGGVDAFLVGSELIGVSRVRGAGGAWPGVAGLIALTVEVRALLGPAAKIGYGADWTEYGGYVPPGLPGDLRFPLDALWAHPAIDFIGLDWYAPLTDRRPDEPRAVFADLQAGMAAGEGHDWFYASDADRLAKTRTPISDPVHGEPWVFRQKDVRAWWSNAHHERTGGVRAGVPTAFVPQSKPVWLMELGFPAVDRGANRPSVFPDPKSSESGLPPFSTGGRDDLEQRTALEAALSWWAEPANNPLSNLTGARMVDTARTHLWAWDARPWPAFPGRRDVWSDGANAATGHWLAGRMCAGDLGAIVADLCRRAGVGSVDTSAVQGLIGGFMLDSPRPARDLLEALGGLFDLELINPPSIESTRQMTPSPRSTRSPGASIALARGDRASRARGPLGPVSSLRAAASRAAGDSATGTQTSRTSAGSPAPCATTNAVSWSRSAARTCKRA
jgi:GTA TIM-barrel-like domain